jgi:hypothetical protein
MKTPDVIVGYVDNFDVVHSQSFSDKKTALAHKQLYGMVLKGWRWEATVGFSTAIKYGGLDPDDIILIKEHLNKRYNI